MSCFHSTIWPEQVYQRARVFARFFNDYTALAGKVTEIMDTQRYQTY